jgi:hypothetical protein
LLHSAERRIGLIEAVTFFNVQNGWAVLKVKATGYRVFVALLAQLPLFALRDGYF